MSAPRSKCECVLRETREAKFHGLLRAKIAGAWGKVRKKETGDTRRVGRCRLFQRRDARLQRGDFSRTIAAVMISGAIAKITTRYANTSQNSFSRRNLRKTPLYLFQISDFNRIVRIIFLYVSHILYCVYVF